MSAEQKGPTRKRRTRAEVHRLVAEFVASGMRQSDFCRSRGLSSGTLHRHLKKQQHRQKSGPTSAVGRLVPVELAAKHPKHSESKCCLTVVLLGGRRVDVYREFDMPTFKRLISVLETA